MKVYISFPSLAPSPGGGAGPYERGGDASRLAWGCKFQMLVLLRVFWGKHHHIISRKGLFSVLHPKKYKKIITDLIDSCNQSLNWSL